MSQFDGKNNIVGSDSGTDHVNDHGSLWDALMTLHSGTSRPTYAQAGTLWLKSSATPQELYFYDGTSDILLATLDFTSHQVTWKGFIHVDAVTGHDKSEHDALGIDADTVDGKNPGSVNGLATLDGSSKVVETANSADDAGNLTMQGEASAENSGVVTVTPSSTDIITLDLGTVTAGDRIYIQGQIFGGEKGGTAGEVLIYLLQDSGTASIRFNNDDYFMINSRPVEASGAASLPLVGLAKVMVSGTLVIKLTGISQGSNLTLAAGEGQLYAFFIKKQ